MRVLVVDDDPSFRALCRRALDRRGHSSPRAVSTPREALETLGARPVDAVVSDVDLPGADGDGVDLYLAVRERWPTLPVVLFTGTPAVGLPAGVDLRADPAVGYVRKGCLPERYDALDRTITRAVGRAQPVDTAGSALRAVEEFCR